MKRGENEVLWGRTACFTASLCTAAKTGKSLLLNVMRSARVKGQSALGRGPFILRLTRAPSFKVCTVSNHRVAVIYYWFHQNISTIVFLCSFLSLIPLLIPIPGTPEYWHQVGIWCYSRDTPLDRSRAVHSDLLFCSSRLYSVLLAFLSSSNLSVYSPLISPSCRSLKIPERSALPEVLWTP